MRIARIIAILLLIVTFLILASTVVVVASWRLFCGSGLPGCMAIFVKIPVKLKRLDTQSSAFESLPSVCCIASIPGRERNIVRIAKEQAAVHHRIYYCTEYKRLPGRTYAVQSVPALPNITLVETADFGPLSKVIAPLQDDALDAETVLIIADDDSYHQSCDLAMLAASAAERFGIHQAESKGIHGSRGYAFRKSVIDASLLRAFATEECFKTDDTLLTGFCQKYNIPILFTRISFPRIFLTNQANKLTSRSRLSEHDSCLRSMAARLTYVAAQGIIT